VRRMSVLIKSFLITIMAIAGVGVIGFFVYSVMVHFSPYNATQIVAPAYADATPEPAQTPLPTLVSDAPQHTPEPTPAPTPAPWELFRPYATEATDPASVRGFRYYSRIEGALYPIHFGLPDTYSYVRGVTTFRGNNFRDSAAYGTVTVTEYRLQERFQFRIGSCCHNRWTGVGWTGQPSIVQWCFEIQQLMNLYPEFRDNPYLVEVVYGTLDGNVYFFCLHSGEFTRPHIRVGVPIKGSITLDPRGYPLLYAGQGDNPAGGRFGYYIFSLICGSEIFFLNGNEAVAPRRWGAFDSNPLFDTANDRMILAGENGVVYNFLLNTTFCRVEGTISIYPQISRYWFQTGRRLGIENSPSAFGHHLFFADNSGTIQCLDLRTFEPVWAFNAGDDTDSTMVLEWNADQERLFIYTATQVDLQGAGGYARIRKLDAVNGTEIWQYAIRCIYNTYVNGGVTASPILGQGDISDLVIFWVAKTIGRGGSGALIAFDRATGEIAWENNYPAWGWSSPTAVYTYDGTSFIILSDSVGNMRLLRGKTGEELYRINLGANIEASPAIFGNTLIVGTRGQRIFGIDIL